MKPHQIESWVLNIVEQVKSGHPVEDSRVELKSKWIEAEKAARRIAGHANAARGASILWIIGVDEKQKQIVGAKHEKLSEWFEKVKSHFDGLSPEMFDLNVPVNDKTVVALLFDTQRAPYVVKNPAFGKVRGESVSLEVPWREGTSTRSVKRSELLMILSPLQALPKFEILGGFLDASLPREPKSELYWTLRLEMYIESKSPELIVIPFHKCKVECDLIEIGWQGFMNISLQPPSSWFTSLSDDRQLRIQSKTIEGTPSEVLINYAGKINLKSEAVTPLIGGSIDKDIRFIITLVPSNSEASAVLEGTLVNSKPDDNEFGRWVYSPIMFDDNATSLLK